MEFSRYSSIENAYREKFILGVKMSVNHREQWVVTEKAHGANYSIYCDGETIRGAKRSAFLPVDPLQNNFFNNSYVHDKLENNIFQLFENIKDYQFFFGNDGIDYIVICGEILGGMYEGAKPRSIYAKKVQKGIYYAPDNELYVFDLKVKFTKEKTANFINYGSAMIFLAGADIPYAKPLKYGTLDECLEYSNEFPSKIYKMYKDKDGNDLKELPDNICEGVVIKPIEPHFLSSGSRVIIKNKNDRWSENSKKREIKPKKEIPPIVLACAEDALVFVNENRLRNVLSHDSGTYTYKDFGRIQGMFTKDVWEDYIKDAGEKFTSLEKPERKILSKYLATECSVIIRKNILNIIDGNF